MDRRYMVYLSNGKGKYFPADYKYLLTHIRSMLKDFSHVLVRDIRVSSYFIEIDLSLYDFKQDLVPNEITSRLNSVGSMLLCDDLSESELFLTRGDAINHAIYLFNIERFWKSHEVLEGVWRESTGLEKRILNGIILIDAAFVHFQKNELDVFISILKRSMEKLQECFGIFYGLNLEEIKVNLNRLIDKNHSYIFKISLC
jgi:hypothetical protein